MSHAALIHEYLPDYDVAEYHRTMVRAPRTLVYEAVRELDLARSHIIRTLFALRSAPALLSRSAIRNRERLGLTLDALLESGFVLLGERPEEELLLGLVGRFWTLSGDILRLDAREFCTFQSPGYAKAVWNFQLSAGENATLLSTETRVSCTDRSSKQSFRLYWALIGPFSGLVRKEALKIIKNVSEAKVSAGARSIGT